MWAARLPLPCTRCGALVHPGQEWHLDHTTPRSQGGHDADARPAHAHCNVTHGAEIGNARKRELIAKGRAVEGIGIVIAFFCRRDSVRAPCLSSRLSPLTPQPRRSRPISTPKRQVPTIPSGMPPSG